jgi:hypothetical protein
MSTPAIREFLSWSGTDLMGAMTGSLFTYHWFPASIETTTGVVAGGLLLAVCLGCFPLVRSDTAVMLYALGMGVAGGLITVIHFAFYGHAFGREYLGRIQGAALVLSVFASALGPLVLATCKSTTDSNDRFFVASAILAVVLGAAAGLVPLRRPVAELLPSGAIEHDDAVHEVSPVA